MVTKWHREYDRQSIPVRQRTPSKRVRTAWPRLLTESTSLTRAKMLSIKGPDTCTFDQTTRPTTSREIPAKPVHYQEVSTSFSSANLFTITPAHLPDCSSNFIEVVLQVLRLCIDSYIQVSSFLSLPRQCIRRALATCRLPFAVSFASPPPGFLPQPFLHSLFLRRCLDAFCRIFLVSSSNLFNTEQFVRYNHKKTCLLSTTPAHALYGRLLFISFWSWRSPLVVGTPELQHLYQSVSSATWSSYATLPTISSRSFLSWLYVRPLGFSWLLISAFKLRKTRMVR